MTRLGRLRWCLWRRGDGRGACWRPSDSLLALSLQATWNSAQLYSSDIERVLAALADKNKGPPVFSKL